MVLGMAPFSSTLTTYSCTVLLTCLILELSFLLWCPFLCISLWGSQLLGPRGPSAKKLYCHWGSLFLGPNSRSQLRWAIHTCCLYGLLCWNVQVLKQPCKFWYYNHFTLSRLISFHFLLSLIWLLWARKVAESLLCGQLVPNALICSSLGCWRTEPGPPSSRPNPRSPHCTAATSARPTAMSMWWKFLILKHQLPWGVPSVFSWIVGNIALMIEKINLQSLVC